MDQHSEQDLEDDEICSAWLNQVSADQNTSTTSRIAQERSHSFKSTFGFLSNEVSDQTVDEDIKKVLSTNQASALGSGKAIIVNSCQRGNPVLELIHGVPWTFADLSVGLAVDYVLGPSTGCLFLSLRYHSLKPDYIYDRLKILCHGGSFALRLLLCLVDIKDSDHAVRELTKVCLVSDVTLLLAFSNDEAATYLETFKAYQNKPSDLLKAKPSLHHPTRAIEVISSVRTVNSTDASTLLNNFGSFAAISKACEEDLGFCPGIGGKKAKCLQSIFQEPFLKEK